MSRQLDILAVEPYFGGIRRNMLETLVRCSRHRWTVLTLPPRRMERRLAAASHWFSEQICRRSNVACDVLFTSDGLNLADLFRMCPAVQDHPSVVYFHSNQLPDLTQAVNQQPLDLTNLTSATAASEIWFNSKQHVGTFLEGIEGMITLMPELQSRNPMDDVLAKLHLVPPPVDTNFYRESAAGPATERDAGSVFVETRDANMDLLNTALAVLQGRNNPIQLYVCGPVDRLISGFPVVQISESDSSAQVGALLAAGTFVSTKIAVPFDENAVRAMSLGCRPVLPHTGIYPELIPIGLHAECLYDMSGESLASLMHEATYLPSIYRLDELTSKLKPYDPLHACATMDTRLDNLAADHLKTSHERARHPLREARRRAIPNA